MRENKVRIVLPPIRRGSGETWVEFVVGDENSESGDLTLSRRFTIENSDSTDRMVKEAAELLIQELYDLVSELKNLPTS